MRVDGCSLGYGGFILFIIIGLWLRGIVWTAFFF